MNLFALTKTLFSSVSGLILANLFPDRHPDRLNILSERTLVGGMACVF